jgi:hypothetical protein
VLAGAIYAFSSCMYCHIFPSPMISDPAPVTSISSTNLLLFLTLRMDGDDFFTLKQVVNRNAGRKIVAYTY